MAPEQTVRPLVSTLYERGDDDVRVERAYDLRADQLEGDRPLGECLERPDGGFRAQPAVACGARLPFGPAGDGLARREFQADLAGDPARWGALQREAGK